jgi:DNA-binding transcriptional LysR family regulator
MLPSDVRTAPLTRRARLAARASNGTMLTPDARTAPFTQRRGYDGLRPAALPSGHPALEDVGPSNVAVDSDDFPMVSGLVESGVGVALIADLAVHQTGRRVVLRRLRPRVVRAASHALTPLRPSPAAAVMLEVLTSRRPA